LRERQLQQVLPVRCRSFLWQACVACRTECRDQSLK